MKEIKEAFERVKLDIYYLNKNFLFLVEEIQEIKNLIKGTLILETGLEKKRFNKIDSEPSFFIPFPSFEKSFLLKNWIFDTQTNTSTGNRGVQTNSFIFQTDNSIFKPLNTQINQISTGNEGVKTDRQTDHQIDNNQIKDSYNQKKVFLSKDFISQEFIEKEELEDTLNSFDHHKKELYSKFKGLTTQELLVFSTIYQLEEEKGHSTYKSLSERLNLTESSIRDYVRRLVFKKIPVEKKKINNKEIQLTISPSLKRIASLNAIIQLKNL